MRISVRRFTRLTNAFSKKIDNHIHALSPYFVWYDFARTHRTHKLSPQLDRLLSMEGVAGLVKAREARAVQKGNFAEVKWPKALQGIVPPSRKDVAGILVVAVMLAIIAVVLVSPRWLDAGRRVNEGFGPEWECRSGADLGGSTICFKKTKAAGQASSGKSN